MSFYIQHTTVATYPNTGTNMNLKPMSKWDTGKPPLTFESEGKLTASKKAESE